MNDVEKIIAQLEKKKAGIDRAIAALREVSDSGLAGRSDEASLGTAPRKKRRLSAVGRKRIAEAARKRWAAQRAGTAGQTSGAAKQASQRKSAARKKRSQRKRAAPKSPPQTEG
jgi:hypothetical protein